MNRLVVVPLMLVLVGIAWPVVMLDGGPLYVDFVRQNPGACTGLAASWAIVLYWLTRRVAELALWRGSGRKLALRERSVSHGRR